MSEGSEDEGKGFFWATFGLGLLCFFLLLGIGGCQYLVQSGAATKIEAQADD